MKSLADCNLGSKTSLILSLYYLSTTTVKYKNHLPKKEKDLLKPIILNADANTMVAVC